jgi:hypothetical protein
MKRKLGLVATAGALAVALALVLSACGGSDGSEGVASLTETTNGAQGSGDGGTSGQRDIEQARLAYTRCMREHGVDLPDPVNGRFQFRSEPGEERKFDEAQEACGHILDAMKTGALTEEQQAEQREAALEFARCMREHGVDVPDPQFQDGGGTTQLIPEGAKDDPDLEEAKRACVRILDAAEPEAPAGQGEAQ